ncbi:hypothetical protein [Mesorhizobium sp. B2-7-3]|uniref:hypothetical protein n=1 Tax=Mesorhizobium sp. B2-7-3 TaxID=2589907 RepID=UPI0015E38B19|nr:hypothetical protein [Mesorhizobium sp. B2-7-3]
MKGWRTVERMANCRETWFRMTAPEDTLNLAELTDTAQAVRAAIELFGLEAATSAAQ